MKIKLIIVAMLFLLVVGTMAVGTSAMYSNEFRLEGGSITSSSKSSTLKTWDEAVRLQNEFLAAMTDAEKKEILNGVGFFSNDTARSALVNGQNRLGGAWFEAEEAVLKNMREHKGHSSHYIQVYYSNVCENVYINDSDKSENKVCGECKVCENGFVPMLFLHNSSEVTKNWQTCGIWNEDDGIWYEYVGKGSFMMTTFYIHKIDMASSANRSWKSYKKTLSASTDWNALATIK